MIELPINIQKELVNTLVVHDQESYEQYLKSTNNEAEKGTQNGIHQQRWDYRYNTIIKVAEKHGLQYLIINRGSLWDAVAVLGMNDDLYIFFSEKNMKKVMRESKKTHYLILLNAFNEEFDHLNPIQGALPVLENDSEDLENQKRIARKMIDTLEKEPKKVVVFTFETGFIASVKAFTYNTKQQLIWETDLSSLIEPGYRFVLEDDEVDPETVESKTHNEPKKPEKSIVGLKS